jgi:hypothetical protein
MAMTVMAIGAAAVMSMQKAAVQGNLDARKTDMANSIARMWVERLHRDAMQWTQPNGANPSGNNFANATLIQPYVNTGWFLPPILAATPNSDLVSPGFDILGRDLDQSSIATAQFCVNVRLTWLVPQALPVEPGLIRADIRVLWPRGIANAPAAGGFCTSAVATLPNPDPYTTGQQPMFHAIYLTTTIRENGW